jgi:nitroimidazol reductase NimA-like FMN-containing flavoprotein (pyridoxamine 5'-phosphate oxidase superfamily)
MLGDDVVFAAPRDGEVHRAVRDAVIALETDRIDPADGWSVVVTGIATEISDPGASPGRVVFRLPTTVVTGRRLERPAMLVTGTVRAGLAGGGAPAAPGPDRQIHPSECLHLLAHAEVGRVAVLTGAGPKMFPVNYAFDGKAIVFRTGGGTLLDAMTDVLVAFHVDRPPGPGSGDTGWAVQVLGIPQIITAADGNGLREHVEALRIRPWAGGERGQYVRIAVLAVSGVRLPEWQSGTGRT